jgi:hypothetical protein
VDLTGEILGHGGEQTHLPVLRAGKDDHAGAYALAQLIGQLEQTLLIGALDLGGNDLLAVHRLGLAEQIAALVAGDLALQLCELLLELFLLREQALDARGQIVIAAKRDKGQVLAKDVKAPGAEIALAASSKLARKAGALLYPN